MYFPVSRIYLIVLANGSSYSMCKFKELSDIC